MLNFVFLTTWLATTPLNFFKSAGTVFDLPTSKPSAFAIRLFKLVETLASLLMSNLSTSASKEIKSFSVAKSDTCSMIYFLFNSITWSIQCYFDFIFNITI